MREIQLRLEAITPKPEMNRMLPAINGALGLRAEEVAKELQALAGRLMWKR